VLCSDNERLVVPNLVREIIDTHKFAGRERTLARSTAFTGSQILPGQGQRRICS
jgi:hypothetical protein